jgi:glucose-6-phosphate isomerase
MKGASDNWEGFLERYTFFESIGLALDFSRTTMPVDYADQNRAMVDRALAEMRELEAGGIANPDEKRMVGHYWLRNPALAPTDGIRAAIEKAVADVKAFAADVHAGRIRGAAGPFKHILLVGIGGSALGPQFVANALSDPLRDKMDIYFLDNTDPDGFERVFARLDRALGETLTIVVSKSGGTKETRNGMLEAQAAYESRGLDFAKHAVAVTSEGSELDKQAAKWIRRFPMWDWVGGRTSELSAVGLLPAALQGFDIDGMLAGAKDTDNVSRSEAPGDNPALLLALQWFYNGKGAGEKAMVVLPYKDRLELISRYLQQLIMESLGKRLDLNGREVNQGLAVYGNKGSTDQHAYVQQLRDGLPNFFAVFIEVLKDRPGQQFEVEPKTTSGDYLTGFLLGTRDALFEQGRESVTITVDQVNSRTVGGLIALFERAVGFYASFIQINAYHQPGVEAGKKAAGEVLRLQQNVLQFLSAAVGRQFSVPEIAGGLGAPQHVDHVFRVCEHLAANGRLRGSDIREPSRARFGL